MSTGWAYSTGGHCLTTLPAPSHPMTHLDIESIQSTLILGPKMSHQDIMVELISLPTTIIIIIVDLP